MRKRIYFKRHRMELDLRQLPPLTELPKGYYWLPWSAELLETHARVKHACFDGETDARVFPSLASLTGCRDLMTAIVTRPGFCPGATWLVVGPDGCVGTVQGLCDSNNYGGIQNLGVMPGYRGLGLGKALLMKALVGFAAAGSPRAFLEVTATNTHAVQLYRRLGFRSYKTLYRSIEVEVPPTPKPAPGAFVGAGL